MERLVWSTELHKANIEKRIHLQIVKQAVRSLWALEYEIEVIQTEFAKGIGSVDVNNLTDDFVEDVMLQSKPLQGIFKCISPMQKFQKMPQTMLIKLQEERREVSLLEILNSLLPTLLCKNMA